MKQKFVRMFSVMLSLLLCISLVACNKNKHEAKEEWKYDEENHWHECLTKDHDDKLNVEKHSFDDGVITIEPTEKTKGEKTYTCTICNYQKKEEMNKLEHTHKFDTTKWKYDENNHWHECSDDDCESKIDEAAHSFDDGVITIEPTEETKGEKTYTCSVCNYQKKEEMNKLEHTHKFDMENWESDESGHWHKATCEHTTEKEGFEEHNFGDWVEETPAGIHVNKVEKRECKVCKYVDRRTVEGTEKHSYSELWSVDSENHWKESNCSGHETPLISEKGVHVYDDDNDSNCNVCNYKRVQEINEIKITLKSREYNKQAQQLEVSEFSIKYGTPKIEYKLTGESDSAYTIEAPINAGNYTVRITVEGNALYSSITKTEEFKINKKTLNFDLTNLEKEYDGTSIYSHNYTEDEGVLPGDEVIYTLNIYDYYGKVEYINAGNYTDLTYQNEQVSNENYIVNNIGLSDPQGTSITIRKKVISGLNYLLKNSNLEGETGTQTILRVVNGTEDKVYVYIEFNIQTLITEHRLTLVEGDAGQGEAKIYFAEDKGDEYLNYEFAETNIGQIQLITY